MRWVGVWWCSLHASQCVPESSVSGKTYTFATQTCRSHTCAPHSRSARPHRARLNARQPATHNFATRQQTEFERGDKVQSTTAFKYSQTGTVIGVHSVGQQESQTEPVSKKRGLSYYLCCGWLASPKAKFCYDVLYDDGRVETNVQPFQIMKRQAAFRSTSV